MSRQEQVGADSSTNVQASRDIVIYESKFTIADVREIALGVFKENFLTLRGVAEKVAIERVEAFTDSFLKELVNRRPQSLGSAEDPDMQQAIYLAQHAFACSGEKDLERTLCDLLVDRADEQTGSLQAIVLNEAIRTAPKLTPGQRRVIAVSFIVGHSSWTGSTIEELYNGYVSQGMLPLAVDVPRDHVTFQHIEYVGAGRLGQLGGIHFLERFSNATTSLMLKGAPPNALPDPLKSLLPDGRGVF